MDLHHNLVNIQMDSIIYKIYKKTMICTKESIYIKYHK